MPRVRLRVQESEIRPDLRSLYTDPRRPGESFVFPVLRLMTTAVFEPRKAGKSSRDLFDEQAVIDTGAWITIVEHRLWSRLDRLGLIEFLPPPAGAPSPRAVVAGGRAEFRLGRFPVALLDRDEPNRPRQLPAVPVIAQLLSDPAFRLPYPIVLGFHGGILDGRVLRREPVLGFDPAAPGPRADAGPRFGQQWYLETS